MKLIKKSDVADREKPESVLIHYFSGTGNTAFAVETIKKNLTVSGIAVSTHFIGRGKTPSYGKTDLHIFAFPVYSWAAPVNVKKYIRSIRAGDISRCAVLSVGGARSSAHNGFGGQALSQIESMLRRKGCRVEMTEEIYLPDNWVQFTNPPGTDEAGKIFLKGETHLREFVSAIIRGEKRYFKTSGFNIAWSKTVAFFYDLIGRRALGKLFIADDTCTACGVCVRSCPVGSISLKGFKRKLPQWDFNCIGCNRCMNTCPEKAVQMSAGRAIVALIAFITLILYIDDLVLLVSGLIPFTLSPSAVFFPKWLTGLVIIILFHIIYFTLFDSILGVLQQRWPLRRFFLLNWTKGFRRYKAPGFNLNKVQERQNCF